MHYTVGLNKCVNRHFINIIAGLTIGTIMYTIRDIFTCYYFDLKTTKITKNLFRTREEIFEFIEYELNKAIRIRTHKRFGYN